MIWIDTETYGTLDLKKVGSYRYAAHEDTKVLLLPYALDNDDPKVIDVDGRPLFEAIKEDAPELLTRLVYNDETVVMHNSNFDRHILDHQDVYINVERIEDTMVQAYTLGYPGNLARLGRVLGLDESSVKLSEGTKLIRRFCMPAPKSHKADRYDRNSHPEEWEQFVNYARMDVVAMRECHKRMPRVNLSEAERKVWFLDQKINDRGVRVDMQYVRNAIALAEQRQQEVTFEIQEITAGEVEKHTKSRAIIDFCEERGIQMPNLQKENVAALLERNKASGHLPESVRRLLELRLEANKATVSKYVAMGVRTSTDSRLRGGFQYGGASRTLRWAGRGVQLHNLARPPHGMDQVIAADALAGGYVDVLFEDPLDVIKGVVRGAFVPGKGKLFAISDLSNIEGRVTAWVAGEKWKVQAFKDFDEGNGPDIYKATFATTFGKPVDKVTKDDRQIGKVLELAGGYQGWVGAWETFAKTYGLGDTPIEEIEKNMGNWRNAHPATRRFWGLLEEVWQRALRDPSTGWKCGQHLSFKYFEKLDMMMVRLPSGRYVVYLEPRYEDGSCSYMGMNDRNMWVRVESYGGKLLENLVQAISRDILAWAMLKLDDLGFDIVLHVHDEVVAEVLAALARKALEQMNQVLATTPDWAPGLPLAAAGFTADRYRKE